MIFAIDRISKSIVIQSEKSLKKEGKQLIESLYYRLVRYSKLCHTFKRLISICIDWR